MTITHHPDESLLLDYATGTLGEAWALAIATHLSLCPECRRSVAELEALGGSLLTSLAPAATAPGSLEAVMARLEHEPPPHEAPAKPLSSSSPPLLPQPLRDYVGGDLNTLQWRRLGRGAAQLIIPTGQKGATARLLRIPAGRPVPEHSHNGMELTLVLCGAFHDLTGHYGRGDLQEADTALSHQPHAEAGEDCICLAITDAPLRFSGLAVRMLQPFLGI